MFREYEDDDEKFSLKYGIHVFGGYCLDFFFFSMV